jgi:hypothetical protein
VFANSGVGVTIQFVMEEHLIREIIELQGKIRIRLLEFGYADDLKATRLSRHLAEIAILGEAFRKTTLPLFLTLDRDNLKTIAQLTVSIKCDLEELSDSLSDAEPDLRDLMEFFNNHTR